MNDRNRNEKKEIFGRKKIGVYGTAQHYFLSLNKNRNKFRDKETRRTFHFFRIDSLEQLPQFRPHVLFHCFFIDDPITEEILRDLSQTCEKFNLIHVGCKRLGEENQVRTLKDMIFPYEVEDYEDFVCLMQDVGTSRENRLVKDVYLEKKGEEELEPLFFSTLKEEKKKKKRSFNLIRIFNSRNSQEEVEDAVVEIVGGGNNNFISEDDENVGNLVSVAEELMSQNEGAELDIENQKSVAGNEKDLEMSLASTLGGEIVRMDSSENILETLKKAYETIQNDDMIEKTLKSLEENEKESSKFLGMDGKKAQVGKAGLPLKDVVQNISQVTAEGKRLKDQLDDYKTKFEHFGKFNKDLLKFLQGLQHRCSKYQKRIEVEKEALEDTISQLEETKFTKFELFEKYRAVYGKLIGYRKKLMRKLLSHTLDDDEEEKLISRLVDAKIKLEGIEKEAKKNIMEVFLEPVSGRFAEIRMEVKRREGKKKKKNLIDTLSCPITKDVLEEPYILTATGESCEKKALQEHFRRSVDHPFRIGERLRHTGIIPNLTVKDLIANEFKKKKR